MNECCENCLYMKELILWNENGKNLPNYKEPSHCCTQGGTVHQINRPDIDMCELFRSIKNKTKLQEAIKIVRESDVFDKTDHSCAGESLKLIERLLLDNYE